LGDLDHVPAGVVQLGDGRAGHLGGRHSEVGAPRLDALVVGLDVVGEEHDGGLALLEESLLVGLGCRIWSCRGRCRSWPRPTPERAADGWDLSPPLANRFLHISYTPSTDGWIDGMTAGFSLPAAGWVAQPSRERRAIARAHVAAFIRCGPAHGDGPDDAGRRRTVRIPAPDHLTAASQALPLGRGRTLRLKPSITVEPMDSSSRLRLALIGAGWREAGAHLPGIDVPTDVYELVGHLRRGHRQSLRNGAGAHGYTSVRELIERERPDVVDVVVPDV